MIATIHFHAEKQYEFSVSTGEHTDLAVNGYGVPCNNRLFQLLSLEGVCNADLSRLAEQTGQPDSFMILPG